MSSSQPAKGSRKMRKLPGNPNPSSQPTAIGRATPTNITDKTNNSVNDKINYQTAQDDPPTHGIDGKDHSCDQNSENNLSS